MNGKLQVGRLKWQNFITDIQEFYVYILNSKLCDIPKRGYIPYRNIGNYILHYIIKTLRLRKNIKPKMYSTRYSRNILHGS